MKCEIDLLGVEYIIDFDVIITYKGAPERGPSYSSGGEPAEPMEFDITYVGLSEKGKDKPLFLFIPDWLEDVIKEYLCTNNKVYQDIENECLNN